MKARKIIVAAFLLIVLLLSNCRNPRIGEKPASKPNVILILADDMGYSDLGCTGSEIETPNLDKLAANGVLFTHFYNTSRCCPSRASLLTGLYQHQAGIGHMDTDLGVPSYQGRLNENSLTIAQALKQQNYRNIMLGKWHLGDEQEHRPLARGFDRMYGIPKGGGVYFYPCVGRDRQVFLNEEQVFPDSNWYSTDAFTDYALIFAEEAKDDQTPFFMYLAYIAPHFPLQAWQEDIEKYKDRYTVGYEHIRKARFEKQKELGIIDPETALSQSDVEDWENVDQEKEALKMAVYAAQIDRLDQNIGRLVQGLKQAKLFDNTVILFLSDNGAASVRLNATPEAELGSRDSWAAYGKSWANVSNTPYRLYKSTEHEGGIITPLIMHWPKGLEKKGLITHEPAHIIDIMPTILELSGATYPENFKGKLLNPLRGSSILSLAKGKKQDPHKLMFWEHQGEQAARKGDWKLVRRHKKPWALYNLREDPIEEVNRIAEMPDKADELKTAYSAWAKEVGVLPWPVRK